MIRRLPILLILGLLLAGGCAQSHYGLFYSSDGDYGYAVQEEQFYGAWLPPPGP